MKNFILQPLLLFCLLLFGFTKSQGQTTIQTDTLRPDPVRENGTLTRFAGDTLVSSFIIHIKKKYGPTNTSTTANMYM
ncbi:MAG: hypothetical protein EXR21_09860 [Flavobacteriaceae bacterium]|nr:hypothetical protein [Flavobacteriaceae bacterium]